MSMRLLDLLKISILIETIFQVFRRALLIIQLTYLEVRLQTHQGNIHFYYREVCRLR